MGIIGKLATSLGRKDEEPNVLLAGEIAERRDAAAISELIGLLEHKDAGIRGDAVKTLYEIGALNPALIAEYRGTFVGLLEHGTNRMVWGAMTALDAIASFDPHAVHGEMPAVLKAADRGSVIAKDRAVSIAIKLYRTEAHSEEAFGQLIGMLESCPTNQLPMYAENTLPVIREEHKAVFAGTLLSRIGEIDKESKRKRVEKIVAKLR